MPGQKMPKLVKKPHRPENFDFKIYSLELGLSNFIASKEIRIKVGTLLSVSKQTACAFTHAWLTVIASYIAVATGG